MNKIEFRKFALESNFSDPELKSLLANKFFHAHTHIEDLIILIKSEKFIVSITSKVQEFEDGDMCIVKAGIEHTNQVGNDGVEYWLAWGAVRLTLLFRNASQISSSF
jgi:cupin superfamily acireductone dioxygenase involved in methionine salvage